ncbi:MAG: RluA family pseudouridine synthase [Sulfobacillus sp.]
MDKEAAECFHVARHRLAGLIRAGAVAVDGRVVTRPAHPLQGGEWVVVDWPLPATQPVAEALPLTVIYQDEQLVVVDKAAGMVVHPAAGHASKTLVNALLARLGSLPGDDPSRPGIVHRLDKDTSGLLVVARTELARQSLIRQLADHSMSRRYLAIAARAPHPLAGTVAAPIGRHPSHRQKMAVTPAGRPAVTHYRTVGELPGGGAIVLLRLETGRTHQIRVHMQALGCALVGDRVYGGPPAARQMLHAYALGLRHPLTEQAILFIAPLPLDLRQALGDQREAAEREARQDAERWAEETGALVVGGN